MTIEQQAKNEIKLNNRNASIKEMEDLYPFLKTNAEKIELLQALLNKLINNKIHENKK